MMLCVPPCTIISVHSTFHGPQLNGLTNNCGRRCTTRHLSKIQLRSNAFSEYTFGTATTYDCRSSGSDNQSALFDSVQSRFRTYSAAVGGQNSSVHAALPLRNSSMVNTRRTACLHVVSDTRLCPAPVNRQEAAYDTA